MRPGTKRIHASASVLLLAACGACDRGEQTQKAGPITQAELRAIPGELLYVSELDEQRSVIFGQRAWGEEKRRLTDGAQAAFPYGTAFKGPVSGWTALVIGDDLYLARGEALRPLYSASGKDWYPRFSPDGRWVLFESDREAYRELYKVPVEGGAPVRLTNDPAGNFDGAWSPDGRSIIFSSSRYGQLDLMLMNAEGGELVRLTRHPGDSVKPDFSPTDGQRVAFISGRDGRDDLFVLRLSNGQAADIKNLTRRAQLGSARVTRFSWRPDGGAIAFSASAPRMRSKIFVVELETEAVRQLSGPEHADSDPAWSQDGRYLAFTQSEGRGRSAVYLMRADGSGRTRLSVAEDGPRVWLPRWSAAGSRKGAAE